MRYGDHQGATGYLIGEPHQGLAYMFTMMNHARLQVGLQGVAVSQRSLQQASDYAHERIQGRTLLAGTSGGPSPIALHPDVQRMLLSMQARTQAMRALALEAATELDLSSQSDKTAALKAQTRVDLLIPIVKGWCTEQSVEISSLGVQIHGGMGYIEETGIGQLWRDARITPIYEGTTAIQANDLIGRKILRDQGAAMSELVNEIRDTATTLATSQDKHLARLGQQIEQGAATLQASVRWCLETANKDTAAVYFGSVPMLMLAGYVLGGWMMGRSALACQESHHTIDPQLGRTQTRLALVYGDLALVPSLGLSHAITSACDVLATRE
ncbi:hypothetical protein DBV39_11630 [Orrella marina]|uniref:Acyl-CoA dehydrogenase n=1 Tax=Orrella marina TaxID=2163011 RepID=A0A2R4XKE1_9BURK|nr:acyl-CoA dehydrogenase [Orrella marina]AWB34248.1 hypothetical protein DBV39_11630 [Orrella marina]